MKRSLLIIAAALCAACFQVPPIVIVPGGPPSTPPATPTPAAKPLATLAFQVLDEDTGAPIDTAFARFTAPDRRVKQANESGYIAFELELGIYEVEFQAVDYAPSTRMFQVEANRQFTVQLKSTKPKPAPPVPAPPVLQPVPNTPPIVIAPPVPPSPAHPLCAMRDSDPQACVRQVAAVYPQLLLTNTFASTVEFTQRVLEVLGPDWGHVGKPRGQHAVPRGFVPIEVAGYHIIGVSHDAIKHRQTGQVVDILGNATANEPCDPSKLSPGDECWKPGPASIIWDPVPAHDWRPENPFVPTVPVR